MNQMLAIKKLDSLVASMARKKQLQTYCQGIYTPFQCPL